MQGAGIVIYIMLFAIIAGGVWVWINRGQPEKNHIGYSLKSVLFFGAGIYFAVSGIKLYLGEAQNTLVESFWDSTDRTYLHYGIILLAVSFIAPYLMKCFFSTYSKCLVPVFGFVYLLVLVAGLLLTGRIDNQTYCVLYVFCLVVGWGITLLFGGKIQYIQKAEFKDSFREALPAISVWMVMTGIYFPNELFINNMEEFSGNYIVFLLITILGSILGLFGLLFLLLLLMPRKLFQIVCLTIAGISCAGYLQANFFNGTLNAMNGDEQEWSPQKLVLNGVIWGVILVIIVVGGYHKKVVRKISTMLCIYISLIQIVSLSWLLSTSDLQDKKENGAITKEGALEVSSGSNVLVFVLDNFDSEWFETIYQQDEQILTPLEDFTYYRNGTSQFAHTNPAIPYMLTGVVWNEDRTGDYFQYAYNNSDYLDNLIEIGIDVKIFTERDLMPEKLYRKLGNYSDEITSQYHAGKTFYTMMRTSLYKIAPFFLKPVYEYYTSDIKEMTYNKAIWSIDNDIFFYNDIVEKRLTTSDEYQNAFRFYHMRGPHSPFYLTEDLQFEPTGRTATMESQGKGSLKIVYEYIEQLKTLGQYDDATIIITADHGQGNILNTEKYNGQPDKTSRTLFLIKQPGEHHESMVINEAEVSQSELIPTILSGFGLDYADYGRTFSEIPVDEKKVRKYVDIYGSYRIVYAVEGHAANLDSWSIESAVYD